MNNHSEQDDKQAGNEAFLSSLKQELDHSTDALDGHTLSRLNSIRHTALAKKPNKTRALLLPFGGLVTACVLVLTISVISPSGVAPQATGDESALEDLEILSSSESLDFYEDYEFYQWLSENEVSA